MRPVLHSEALLLEHLADIEVIGWERPTLKSSDGEGRRSVIEAVRSGKQVELALTAKTFRQHDGVPNKRYLRIAKSALGDVARSFVGKPMLVDHASWSQRSRIGTITSSEQVADGNGAAFRMGLRVVKPDAVISVLDGTLDRFSIGWSATGPVLCSVHRKDPRSSGSCGCWPGDQVMGDDGKLQTVEFEFQSAEGTEVSAVNVPAVAGTGIEEVRTQLAAELGFDPTRRAHPASVPTRNRSSPPTRRPTLPAPDVLADTARQLGLDVKLLRDQAARIGSSLVRPPESSDESSDESELVAYAKELEAEIGVIARAWGLDEDDMRARAGFARRDAQPETAPLPQDAEIKDEEH